MDNFHALAAQTALREMFEGKHFDICTVKEVMKLTGCVGNKKDMDALSALHCVNFDAMTAELRQMLFERTMKIFETPAFNMSEGLTVDTFKRDDTHLLN